jgi:hypothetical protein
MARRRGLTLDDLLAMDDLALNLAWKRTVEGGRGSFTRRPGSLWSSSPVARLP